MSNYPMVNEINRLVGDLLAEAVKSCMRDFH